MNKYESKNKADSSDRRIRKTRSALKKSLAALMQKQNIKDISVKELTELADINRGTFYLHYKDVFDLLEQTEQDMMDELHHVVSDISAETIRDNDAILFEKVYTLCEKNADMTHILLGENGDIKFLNNLNTFFKEKCLNDWGTVMREKYTKDFDAYFSFLVGGVISLLQYWFSTGMKESPEELAQITMRFLKHNA